MMTKALRNFKKVVAIVTSWSLALAPLSLMPAQAFAQAQDADESNFSKAVNLESDLIALADRASYPNIPRRGLRGMPTASELSQVESRLRDLQKSMQTLPASVARITDENLEALPFLEIQAFFTCASKFEGLKILLGQSVDPQTWDAQYRLDFALGNLSQLRFVDAAGLLSDSFVKLPGQSDELIAKRSSQVLTVRSHLDLQRGILSLRLSPQFLEDFERMSFLNRMNTKSSLLFAGHFAVHRLFDSLTATRFLMRQSPESTPEVPAFWAEKFASLKVKRSESILTQKNQILSVLKPQLLEAIKTAYVNLENQNRALMLDEEFFRSLRATANLTGNPLDLAQVNSDETSTWSDAIASLITLWNMNDVVSGTPTLVFEAKRLSLRWLILGTETWSSQLDAAATLKVSALIDERARAFTQNFMRDIELQKNIAEIARSGPARVQLSLREEFQKNLDAASKRLHEFETSKINLRALMAAHNYDLQELVKTNSSPILKAAIDGVAKAESYEAGYLTYRTFLFSMLQAYQLPRPLPSPLTISYLDSIKKKIVFNPASLTETVPQKYIQALAASLPARAQDVSSMLELGRIMKFDVLEKLNEQNKTATPQTLQLNDGLLAGIWGSEKRSYFEEFKKDIVNNAPVLGAVWEQLAAGQMSHDQASSLVDSEIKKIPARISANLSGLQVQWDKVEGGANDSLDNVSEEMRTLVTRASQLSLILSSFAGFSSLNDEIRQELLEPGFAGREWKQFSSWSTSVITYMLGFFALQLVGSKVTAVGRASDVVAKFFAPIFGPNFSRLNIAFWGILGITVSDTAYRGFYSEPAREEILKRYSECNAGGPCVALYSDLSKQSEIARTARMETVSQIAMMAIIVGGFILARKVIARFARGIPHNSLNQLHSDLQTLGLSESTALSEQSLQQGLRNAVQRARGQSDPLVAELAETYARQSADRIQSTIWKEASRWLDIDARFAKDLKTMGLSPRQAKNMESVNAAFSNIEAQYKRGRLSTSEYQDLKGTVLAIFQTMEPTWAKMNKSPLLKNFYEKVWDASSGLVRAEIRGNQTYYNAQISARFMKEIERLYATTKNHRFETMLENMIRQTQQQPTAARQNLQALREALNQGGQK